MAVFLSSEVPLQRFVRTRVQRNWYYLDNGIPAYGDRAPSNNKPFWFVLTILLATVSVSVYALIDFMHAESVWTVFKASTATVLLLLWPIWLLLGCILYFAKREMPVRNSTAIGTIQAKVNDLIHRDLLPFNPLVVVNAMYGQLQRPRRVCLPLQVAQLYVLSTCLANIYIHDMDKEYASFRQVIRERLKKKRPFLENLLYGLDSLFAYVDGDADRLRLFEIASKMSRSLDFYEGVSLPARYEDVPRTIGFFVAKFHQELFRISLKYQFNLTDCVIEYLDKMEDRESVTFCRAASYYAEKLTPSSMGSMAYNPACTQALKRFESVKTQTQCLFAATSRLWSAPDFEPTLSIEENVVRCKDVLSKFIITAKYEHLDGFVFEIPDNDAGEFGGSPEAVGKVMKRVLTALDKVDSAREMSMEQNLSRQSWQFTYNHQRIFITSFAPCYPPTNPRHAFGSKSVWILFQPEYSFSHHQIPPSRQPGGIRQRTRDAFEKAGRPYEIPTRRDLMGHIYVKPLDDIRDPRITWWDSVDEEKKSVLPPLQPDF